MELKMPRIAQVKINPKRPKRKQQNLMRSRLKEAQRLMKVYSRRSCQEDRKRLR